MQLWFWQTRMSCPSTNTHFERGRKGKPRTGELLDLLGGFWFYIYFLLRTTKRGRRSVQIVITLRCHISNLQVCHDVSCLFCLGTRPPPGCMAKEVSIDLKLVCLLVTITSWRTSQFSNVRWFELVYSSDHWRDQSDCLSLLIQDHIGKVRTNPQRDLRIYHFLFAASSMQHGGSVVSGLVGSDGATVLTYGASCFIPHALRSKQEALALI